MSLGTNHPLKPGFSKNSKHVEVQIQLIFFYLYHVTDFVHKTYRLRSRTQSTIKCCSINKHVLIKIRPTWQDHHFINSQSPNLTYFVIHKPSQTMVECLHTYYVPSYASVLQPLSFAQTPMIPTRRLLILALSLTYKSIHIESNNITSFFKQIKLYVCATFK